MFCERVRLCVFPRKWNRAFQHLLILRGLDRHARWLSAQLWEQDRQNSNSKGICRPNECTSALPSANNSPLTPNLRVKKWNGFTFPDLRTTKIATGMRTERKCRRAVLGTWVLVTCCCRCSRGVGWETPWYLTPVTDQPRDGNNIFSYSTSTITKISSLIKLFNTDISNYNVYQSEAPKQDESDLLSVCYLIERNLQRSLQYTPTELIIVYWPYIDSRPRLFDQEIDNRVSLSQWVSKHTIGKFTDHFKIISLNW